MKAKASDAPPPKWLYFALAAVIVAIYWLPRLFRGFWVDEAATYWVSRNGIATVWDKLQVYPGQSVLYGYLCALFTYSGPYKEVLLRLPSVVGVLLSAWVLFKLTERIAGSGCGFLAVIPFLSSTAVVEIATNARPYGLGMAVALGSFWSLREWVYNNTNRFLILYGICSSLAIYFHYAFGLIFPVQIIYLVMARRRGREFPWTRLLVVGGLILVAVLPLARQFFTVAHRSDTFKTAALPGLTTFLSLYPLQVFTVAGISLLFYRILYPKWFRGLRLPERDDLALLAVWLLLGPVLVFIAVRMTGYALFSTRYLIYALFPFFVLVAISIRQIGNESARLAVLFAIALNAGIHVPMIRQAEWRTPLEVAQRLAGRETPLLIRSSFVDSASADLRDEPKPSSYLFAPLIAYPVANDVIPVPFFTNDAAAQLLERQIQQRASMHRRFCLVAEDGSDVLGLLPSWFRNNGYQTSVHNVGSFTIMIFDRPAQADISQSRFRASLGT